MAANRTQLAQLMTLVGEGKEEKGSVQFRDIRSRGGEVENPPLQIHGFHILKKVAYIFFGERIRRKKEGAPTVLLIKGEKGKADQQPKVYSDLRAQLSEQQMIELPTMRAKDERKKGNTMISSSRRGDARILLLDPQLLLEKVFIDEKTEKKHTIGMKRRRDGTTNKVFVSSPFLY